MTAVQYVGKQIRNYRITEQLYEGGIGTVYRAELPQIGRHVAIKVIDLALSEDPEVSKQFLDEAKMIATIDHPNIIDIYDVGRTEHGHLYYVTELLKGETLSERLNARGRMALREAGPYLVQICTGLNAAHSAGVIHRDLRPENILLKETLRPTVKITDFGVAKVLDIEPRGLAKTAKGIVMGTPLTISPEQAEGLHDQLGPQTDIYSLGVILYWMLAGHPPFFEGPAAVILARHITAAPPPLKSVVPEVTDGVAAIVHKCLSKDPQDRPSATEVAAVISEELERIGVSLLSGTYRSPSISDTLPPIPDDAEDAPTRKLPTKPLKELDEPHVAPDAAADARPPAIPFRETAPIPQQDLPQTEAKTKTETEDEDRPTRKIPTKPFKGLDEPHVSTAPNTAAGADAGQTAPVQHPQPELPQTQTEAKTESAAEAETETETGADDAALRPQTESGPREFQLPPDSSVHPMLWGARVVTAVGPDGKLEPQFEPPPRRKLGWAVWAMVALAIVSITVFVVICVLYL